MSEKLTIAHWAEEDQPREKLRDKGPQALSDAELLAILVGSGSPGESAVELMKRILNDCNNNLNSLGKMSIHQLCGFKGIGEAKAITILAACELGKRRQRETAEERPDCGTATRIYNHMHPIMQDLDVEEFWALFFNPKQEMLRRVRICRGEVSEDAADPRNIMRFGVLYNATYIVTVHNHVSGNPSPTKFDSIIAAKLAKASEAVRMKLRDHIILGDGSYFSFAENKKL